MITISDLVSEYGKRAVQLLFSAVPLLLVAAGMPFARSATQHLSTAATALEQPSTTWTACTLFSKLELEEIVAVPLKDGEARGNRDTGSACFFGGKSGGRVVVLLRRVPNAAWSSEQVQRMEAAALQGSYHDVPGIGDRSFLFDMHAAGAAMCIFRGDFYLEISVLGLEAVANASSAVERLASKAVTRF